MIEKIFDTIQNSKIVIYGLNSGRKLIGESYKEDDTSITLRCPFEIQQLFVAPNGYRQIYTPFVVNNDNEECTIYKRSVETLTAATDDVRSKYIEALITDRLLNLLDLVDPLDPSLAIDKPLSQSSCSKLINRWKL
jgi:hypothetical protein